MNTNSFVYTNIPSEWLANIESTREKLEKKRLEKEKNSRGSTSILRSTLDPKPVAKEGNAFKRRYKTIPKAGLFAHAVCSSNYRSLDKIETNLERESQHDSPELKKQRLFTVETTPRCKNLEEFEKDFERASHPELEKQQFEEFSAMKKVEASPRFEDLDEFEKEFEKASYHASPELKKQRWEATPTLQRQASDAETSCSKIEQFIENFSRRLDCLKFEPELFIRSRIPLAKLETGILNRVLRQPSGKSTMPVADIVEKNSDILLYAEDLKNKKDYIPSDPHFLTDEIASNFDSHLAALENQKSLNLFRDFEVGDSNQEGIDEDLNFSADLFSASKDEEEEDFFDEKDDEEESQINFNIFNIIEFPSTCQWRPQTPVLNIFEDLDDPDVPSSSSASSLPPFKDYLESEKRKEESSSLNFFNF